MENKDYRLYGYRWVVLAAFMFINLTIQILWIAYAPITGPAAAFYGVTDLQIGFLARTPRGRAATPAAYEHLDIKLPSSGGLF